MCVCVRARVRVCVCGRCIFVFHHRQQHHTSSDRDPLARDLRTLVAACRIAAAQLHAASLQPTLAAISAKPFHAIAIGKPPPSANLCRIARYAAAPSAIARRHHRQRTSAASRGMLRQPSPSAIAPCQRRPPTAAASRRGMLPRPRAASPRPTPAEILMNSCPIFFRETLGSWKSISRGVMFTVTRSRD